MTEVLFGAVLAATPPIRRAAFIGVRSVTRAIVNLGQRLSAEASFPTRPAHAASGSGAFRPRDALNLLLLAAIWAAAVFLVYPRGEFPLIDWVYRWSVAEFLNGRFVLHSWTSATMAGHILLGRPVCRAARPGIRGAAGVRADRRPARHHGALFVVAQRPRRTRPCLRGRALPDAQPYLLSIVLHLHDRRALCRHPDRGAGAARPCPSGRRPAGAGGRLARGLGRPVDPPDRRRHTHRARHRHHLARRLALARAGHGHGTGAGLHRGTAGLRILARRHPARAGAVRPELRRDCEPPRRPMVGDRDRGRQRLYLPLSLWRAFHDAPRHPRLSRHDHRAAHPGGHCRAFGRVRSSRFASPWRFF
jgi:hypothetical protein